MPVRLIPAGSVHDRADDGPARWTCALINNMPDGAFEATERQYLGLLNAGSGQDVVKVRRYTMDGVPRAARVAERIAQLYSPLSDVYRDPPDLLIITGSNPIEKRITDEPYWEDLASILEWARNNVLSTLLSCLSAHAALLVYDDIPRAQLPTKCTGVFNQRVKGSHLLTSGIESSILLPHSRNNTVPPEALEDAGYEIVIDSDTIGWSVATRAFGAHQVVLVQGHPEYDPSSLLREYHRDAGRYVHHERDVLPVLPFHCVATEDWGRLEQIQHAIITGSRIPQLIDAYPFDEVGARAPWPWRAMAERFYNNWMGGAVARASGDDRLS